MFITDMQVSLVAADHTVGYDDDLALRQNLVQPAVDDAGDLHDRTQFFGELTNKAGFRGFAGFEATARQFPFVAFVFKQRNTARFDEDAFDGHREIHRRFSQTEIDPGRLAGDGGGSALLVEKQSDPSASITPAVPAAPR